MEFQALALLFESLEKSSKRLNKALLLRDFLLSYPQEAPLVFDMIAGNYQREIQKRSIGISLKSIFSVLSFLSGKNKESDIQKQFNKIGDIGTLASELLQETKQESLFLSSLSLEDITFSFEKISKTNGKNASKIKGELITKLFLATKTPLERKFLARVLIDDYRIGVSSGVLREACVHALFPKVMNIHFICSSCSKINLNTEQCFYCKNKLDNKNQEELIKKQFSLKEEEKTLQHTLKKVKSHEFIKSKEERILFNELLSLFEKKYYLLNSFRIILFELQKDYSSLFSSEIMLGRPFTSMLGTRASSSSEALKMTGKEVLADFKYDGLRLQIHNNKGKVHLFSRNLEDTSSQFLEVIEYIKKNFSDLSFVLDSECVGYDYKTMKFLPFQNLSRRILVKDQTSVSHIKVVVRAFDLLYLNGKTLIDESYAKRRELMNDLFLNRELKEKLNIDKEVLKNIVNQL